MRTITAAALLLLAVPSVALAEKQPPPVAGPARGFTVPEPKTVTLSNGFRMTFVEWGTVPKATLVLELRSGNVNEGPQEVALADLTANLMREGTTTKTGAQISEAAARMGGALEIGVQADRTQMTSDVLSEFAAEAATLMADVALHPKFPESELPRLKADLIRTVSVARTSPGQLAQEKFRAVLYPDHPYGRLFPTEEMVNGFTVDKIKAFYAANWGGQRGHLYVAGRFDRAAVENAARRAFGLWAKGPAPVTNPPKPHAARGLYVIDRPDAVQSSVIVGMPVVDPSNPDYLALSVTNTLLGGYFSSRMTANLRENKGYTYSPHSDLSVRYRDASWAEIADVTTKDTGASLKEIFGEIDRLQAEAPPAAELDAVKSYLSGIFVLRNATRGGLIGQLQFLDLHGLPRTYLTDWVKNVQALTPAQIQQMAVKYLDDPKAAIVVVGDRKVIDEQLKEYGPETK